VHRLWQLRYLLRIGRIGGEVCSQLQNVRLLRPLHGLLPAVADCAELGAENQLCPTGAIQRNYVEDPYFEYTIDERLCIGCGKCVKGCNTFGNGSLYLQVRYDRCQHCNECAIAVACPSQAYRRVPADDPYLLKIREQQG